MLNGWKPRGCWSQFVSTGWVTLQMLFFRDNNTLFKPKAVSTYCSNIEATHIINSHTETRFSVSRLHTSSQSACELSSISKKHDHRGHAEKKYYTRKKAKPRSGSDFSNLWPSLPVSRWTCMCLCAHTHGREHMWVQTGKNTSVFSQTGYTRRVKSHQATAQHFVFWAGTFYPQTSESRDTTRESYAKDPALNPTCYRLQKMCRWNISNPDLLSSRSLSAFAGKLWGWFLVLAKTATYA